MPFVPEHIVARFVMTREKASLISEAKSPVTDPIDGFTSTHASEVATIGFTWFRFRVYMHLCVFVSVHV
jgi:hypothetical protein